MEVQLTRRLFSVDEYLKMIDVGILGRADHVELIDGDILQMAPIGPSHASCVTMLTRRLVIGVGDRGLVAPQLTLPLDARSAPEPDLTVLRPREVPYRETWALPRDVLLLIEVSDTSPRHDREVKLPLYARAGIQELWIVDVAGERVLVHREPHDAGYAAMRAHGRDATVAPLAFPDLHVSVEEIFR
ncbi:MAG TPA: Uma2 family endonuclease [Methylomirabilota bacterium]|nr:Uma2 family endonuclease [Methylomirabilota bacterium]